MTGSSRKFLAVSDETAECVSAMVYAGLRAEALGAGLVILRCARVPGVAGWIGLDKDILQDAMDAARLKAQVHVDVVRERTGANVQLEISEDDAVDAIRKLVRRDPAIKTLILASGGGRFGPGPLVSRIGKGKSLADRPLAVTVIPANLTDAEVTDMGAEAG
jgi:hypothetical protein